VPGDGRVIRVTGIALAGLSSVLHVIFWRSAGALWRDELISVRVALSPTWTVFRQRLPFDSFPALWPLILKLWLATAADVRLLGLLSGLVTLASIWIAARLVGAGPPVLALAVVGTSAAVIRFGDSIRAYGLGNAAAVLAAAAIYAALKKKTATAYGLATVITILAVQLTYFNAVLAFACCVAAAMTAIGSREPREAWKPLALGAVSAMTLVPYFNVLRERAVWSIAEKSSTPPLVYAKNLFLTLRVYGALGITLGLAAGALFFLLRGRDSRSLYLVLLSFLFLFAHCLFVGWTHYFPQPWHYLALVVVLAWCADLLLVRFEKVRLAAALLVVASAIRLTSHDVTLRQTNADVAADLVTANAAPDDLVVVYPWFCAVSFDAYYRRANWTMVPPLADPAGQRYDLLLEADRPESINPVIARMEAAIRGGHRVWLVGFPIFSGSDPMDVVWSSALLRTIMQCSKRKLILKGDEHISAYERMQVGVFSR
jgi:hypothetical protein